MVVIHDESEIRHETTTAQEVDDAERTTADVEEGEEEEKRDGEKELVEVEVVAVGAAGVTRPVPDPVRLPVENLPRPRKKRSLNTKPPSLLCMRGRLSSRSVGYKSPRTTGSGVSLR